MADHIHHEEHPHHHQGADPASEAFGVEMLDLDGEVLHDFWAHVFSLVKQATTGRPPRRIVDLGAGSGNGTIGLALQFPAAEVVAVDSSERMLRRIDDKAAARGLSRRVRAVQADLDAGWPAIGDPADVVWASMSIHHMADADRAVEDIAAGLVPEGVVALIEFDEPVRFLPDDVGIGRPGLEDRCLGALAAEHAAAVPNIGLDWAARLAAGGFTRVEQHDIAIDLRPPAGGPAGRYAQLWFGRMVAGAAHRFAEEDLATLTALVTDRGPGALTERDDLHLRGTRTLIIGRK
jgi:ubiquinone/menaquinone biosynthesis C-methylase UbiE